jgi:hypothetical protein
MEPLAVRPAVAIRRPVGRRAIMFRIAVALLPTVTCGAVVVPNTIDCFCGPSMTELARRQVTRLVRDDYAQWRRTNPDDTCPTIEDLLPQPKHRRDPWDSPLWMDCVRGPIGAPVLYAVSAGEDQCFGTSDDVWSHR